MINVKIEHKGAVEHLRKIPNTISRDTKEVFCRK
jgi:hypothetical protein